MVRKYGFLGSERTVHGYGGGANRCTGTTARHPRLKPQNRRFPLHRPDHPLDLNKAALEELCTIPGLGPALAGRIVQHRAHTPFRSVEDLKDVPGIGEKRLEMARPYVTLVEDPADVGPRPAPTPANAP